MRDRLAAAALLAGLAPCAASAQLGADLPEGTQPAQWRVIWQEDPAHEAVVAWTTDSEGPSRLHLDTRAHEGRVAEYPRAVGCTSDRHTLSLDYFHHCALAGLAPSTRYYFVMQTGQHTSRELYFVTAPADPDAPFALLFGGDSRSDSAQRRAVDRAIARLVAEDPRIIALAHGGDYVERGTSWAQWRQWLSDHELTTGPDGRVLPLIPTRGNHEAIGSLYDEIWASPGGEGNYFSTTIGRFVLITLNTETAQSGEQRGWLERELERAAGRARWVTAQYHRPAWPAVKQPGGALMHWVPLFERFDVDLVFESDGHVLKRTVPIRDGAQDPTGVVYVGEGGLGVAQRTPDRDRWYLAPPGFAAAAHHVQKLTVTPEGLRYEALSPAGGRLDAYTARPRDRGQDPAPPEVGDVDDAETGQEAAPRAPAGAASERSQADVSSCAGVHAGLGVAPVLLALAAIGLGVWRRRRSS